MRRGEVQDPRNGCLRRRALWRSREGFTSGLEIGTGDRGCEWGVSEEVTIGVKGVSRGSVCGGVEEGEEGGVVQNVSGIFSLDREGEELPQEVLLRDDRRRTVLTSSPDLRTAGGP